MQHIREEQRRLAAAKGRKDIDADPAAARKRPAAAIAYGKPVLEQHHPDVRIERIATVRANRVQRDGDAASYVTGITLPGMPANAPGMAPEKTGTLRIFAFAESGVTVFSDE